MSTAQTAEWDRAAFIAWLRAQPPGAVVGISDNGDACPIAHWRQALGEVVWVSSASIEYTYHAIGRIPCPGWVSEFIEELDGRHAVECDTELDFYSQEPITARECLDVLGETG